VLEAVPGGEGSAGGELAGEAEGEGEAAPPRPHRPGGIAEHPRRWVSIGSLALSSRPTRCCSRCSFQPTLVHVPAQMNPRMPQASRPPAGASVSVLPLTDQL